MQWPRRIYGTVSSDTSTRGRYSHVGYPPKLLEQVPRQKGDDGVLGRNDLVGRVDMLGPDATFAIEVVRGQVLIGIYGPGGTGLLLLDEKVLYVECSELGVTACDTRGPARQKHGLADVAGVSEIGVGANGGRAAINRRQACLEIIIEIEMTRRAHDDSA